MNINEQTIIEQTPPCKHFGKCGGCQLQNLSDKSYYNIKKDNLTKIIKTLNVDDKSVEGIIKIGRKSRRRADIKVEVANKEVKVGFYSAKTHNVIDIEQCLIIEEQLANLLPHIKKLVKSLKKPGLIKSISCTQLANGIDIIIYTKSPIKTNDRQKIIEFSKENNITRLCEKSDNEQTTYLYDNYNSLTYFANIAVEIPSGAFLQATEKGQQAITDFIINNIQTSNNVIDLFSGCGTYSFAIIQKVKYIACYEGDYDMTMATNNAAKKNNLDNKILAKTRDLFKNPIKQNQLDAFDTAIINPPRAGALAQTKQLSNSKIDKIIMVSCNPNTFKRDAKILIDGGYNLTKATPIDQFYWTNHLEIAAIFKKTKYS